MIEREEPYRVIGLMSGTSLDGLDIAACTFEGDNIQKFEIVAANTSKYDSSFISKLRKAHLMKAEELCLLDAEFAKFCALQVRSFCELNHFKPDFIASHGHTVFHQPNHSYTLQIGNPGTIAAISGFIVLGDFRTQDIALGGQGAPLVPIGDDLLFSNFDACLNLGGIANISFQQNQTRIAFDICVLNMALNHIANREGLEFDNHGKLAAGGRIEIDLLQKLSDLLYYQEAKPKSLGREWFEAILVPILDETNYSSADLLATLTDHFAQEINKAIPSGCKSVLITGGGTFNSHFINRLHHYRPGIWVVPAKELINFKEALIFAFLGLKRWRGEINCLASVTGASRNHCSGGIFLAC